MERRVVISGPGEKIIAQLKDTIENLEHGSAAFVVPGNGESEPDLRVEFSPEGDPDEPVLVDFS